MYAPCPSRPGHIVLRSAGATELELSSIRRQTSQAAVTAPRAGHCAAGSLFSYRYLHSHQKDKAVLVCSSSSSGGGSSSSSSGGGGSSRGISSGSSGRLRGWLSQQQQSPMAPGRWFRRSASIAGGISVGLVAAGIWYSQGRLSGRGLSTSSSATGIGVMNDSTAATQPDEPGPGAHKAFSGQGQAGSSSAAGLVLQSGACMLPHPEKVAKGGEDAYFIGDNARTIGVADGVGGWADIGVDAGLYSRGLMGHAKSAAGRLPVSPTTPQEILQAAYKETTVRGSSTACILVLHGDELYASNLGDSGFMVVRGSELVFQSPQQQHDFNFPYQMGSPGTASDPPSSAQHFAVKVQPGDVVVVGTDGLLDNVFPDEAAAIAAVAYRKGEPPHVTAEALTAFARMRASDKKHMSPFAYAAQSLGYYYTGGKMDDITVVVSYVTEVPGAARGSGGGDSAVAEAADGSGGDGDGSGPQPRL